VRIWNWQSRHVIAILTGHSHYVMCATFHPEETLLASASLDQTIRIWDFSKLKEKSMQKTGSRPNDIFGGTEVEVKHILEGHEKGVNWVTFHPTMKIVASGSDDKSIKLWRLSGTRHWEMDNLKGHANNVSSVIFHPRQEILISNSEDKTLRIWDLNRRVQIGMVRKDTDRFWILAAHPTLNYFATGFDNGMTVFKLERERFATQRIGSYVIYPKAHNLYFYDLSTKEKGVISPINSSGKQVFNNQPKTMYYNTFNPSQHDFIMNFDFEGGQFVILELHKDIKQAKVLGEKRGDSTLGAVFISKDKLCVLDKNRDLSVCNYDGTGAKKVQINRKTPGSNKIENIFPAPMGKILVQTEDALFLYDISARKVISEIQQTNIKQVVWSSNYNYVVLIAKKRKALTPKLFRDHHGQ